LNLLKSGASSAAETQPCNCESFPMPVSFNPEGDGNCQFAAAADQLNKLHGLLLTAECCQHDAVHCTVDRWLERVCV